MNMRFSLSQKTHVLEKALDFRFQGVWNLQVSKLGLVDNLALLVLLLVLVLAKLATNLVQANSLPMKSCSNPATCCFCQRGQYRPPGHHHNWLGIRCSQSIKWDGYFQKCPKIQKVTCHLDHLYRGGRKIGHVEKFQISMHNRGGEIRNLKFILFLVVISVLLQFTVFLLKLFYRNLRACVWKEIEPKIL